MKLTESKIRDIVRECIINEANKIRRIRDDEFPFKQLDIDDFSEDKEADKRFNQKYGLTGDDKRDSLKPFKSVNKRMRDTVDDYQLQLTNRIQGDLKKQGKSIYVPKKELNAPSSVKEKLSKNGFEIEVKGKTFAYGNTKLPPSTMIINLTSAFNCPSEHCPLKNGICYAGASEKQYANTNLRNLRNEYTLELLTVKEILHLLDLYIKGSTVKIKNIRLSESGDFKSQEVVDFCEKLARHVEAKYGIRTTCYTHQHFDFTNCKSMIVNSSLPGKVIKGADRNYLVKFTEKAFEKVPEGLHIDEAAGKATFKCHCDCYKCNFCYNRKEENGEHPDIRTDVWVLKH